MIMVERNYNTLSTTEYRILLVEEMKKMNASQSDISRIKDATIKNAIKRNRKPEDVAWALLQ